MDKLGPTYTPKSNVQGFGANVLRLGLRIGQQCHKLVEHRHLLGGQWQGLLELRFGFLLIDRFQTETRMPRMRPGHTILSWHVLR